MDSDITLNSIKENKNNYQYLRNAYGLLKNRNHIDRKTFVMIMSILNMENFSITFSDVVDVFHIIENNSIDFFENDYKSFGFLIKKLDNDSIIKVLNYLSESKNSQDYFYYTVEYLVNILFNEYNIKNVVPDFVRMFINALRQFDDYSNGELVYFLSMYLEEKFDLSKEQISAFLEFGENPIDVVSEQCITSEMIEKAIQNNYALNKNSPSFIYTNREILKKLIASNSDNITFKDEYILDEELRDIALKNGYAYRVDDYKKHGILTEKIAIDLLKKYKETHKVTRSGNMVTYCSSTNIDEIDNLILKMLCELGDNNIFTDSVVEMLNDDFMPLQFIDEQIIVNSGLLTKEKTVIALMKILGNDIANSIQFEPTFELIKAYYEAGYKIGNNASKYIYNSKELYEQAFEMNDDVFVCAAIEYGNNEFLTRDLLNKAVRNGYNPTKWFQIEHTDKFYVNDVSCFIDKINDLDYKEFCQKIRELAGDTIFYFEKNNLLSYKSFICFGESLLIKIVRNLLSVGKSMDFGYIISNDLLDDFKKYYDLFKKSDDIREFFYLYNQYDLHRDLINDLMKNGMTDEEKTNFSNYLFQKVKGFVVSKREELNNIYTLLYNENNRLLLREDDKKTKLDVLKNAIISTLFNLNVGDVKSLNGIISLDRIQDLRKKVDSESMISLLDSYGCIMLFIDSICKNYDLDNLEEILNNINRMLIDNSGFIDELREIASNMENVSKEIYSYELNCSLSSLSSGELRKYEKIEYIDYGEDSYFLAHVMNAFGSGSTLKDFKESRFFGKTYICLTAIGKGVVPYFREQKDLNHVTLLFNKIPKNSLISMSYRDMHSSGCIGQLDVFVTNNFYSLSTILDKTNGLPNEYVVYRDNGETSLYPCAILVTSDVPSKEEIEAAEYLEIPLVKRNKVKKIDSSGYSNNNEVDFTVYFDNPLYSKLNELIDVGTISHDNNIRKM